MQVDHIIIGQGICGTLLSYELLQAGRSVVVIDKPATHSASRVASGLINPVTGKRLVKSWMTDTLLPAARSCYTKLEEELGVPLVKDIRLLDFFRSDEEEAIFSRRAEEDETFLSAVNDQDEWLRMFQFHFGIGATDCMLIDIRLLLDTWRTRLIERNALLEETFDWSACIENGKDVRYRHIEASSVICCEGAAAYHHTFFAKLPWSPNKGEALIVSIPGLSGDHIYKSGMKIAPWKDELFWVGASYEWKYENILPSATFRERTEQWLHSFLKLPFTIVDQLSAERPASLDYKPFIGFHPLHPNIGIFNGMGSKACSMAPYFAKQFAANLTNDTPLLQEVDIKRFSRILSR